jgi:hypothetical protein
MMMICPATMSGAHVAFCSYRRLDRDIPDEFLGYPTRFAPAPGDPGVRVPTSSPTAKAHIEVTSVEEYAARNLGVARPPDDVAWLTIPEHKLLEFTRGEVFHDGLGTLSELREYYGSYYPLGVWKYRLAYAWQAAGWDADLIGLCARRGDTLSALHAVGTTLHQLMRLVFLLNRCYGPTYPKWFHREFYRLPHLAQEIGPQMENCYRDPDLERVEQGCQAMSRQLIDFQDGLGLLSKAMVRDYPFSRTFFRLDTNYVARQIQDTLVGQLRALPLYGAADQWVGNPDLLLSPDRLDFAEALYRRSLADPWPRKASQDDMNREIHT